MENIPSGSYACQVTFGPGRRLTRDLIFHSDRGVEYSAYAFRTRLAALEIRQSMTRPRVMGLWLHALVLLAVVLVFGASFALLSGVIGITSPWLVLLLMFYFLGIARIAEPLFMLRMPRVLRPLRRWEREGDVYRRLRVLSFGRLLRQAPLRSLNSAVYLDRERRDPLQVRLHAESSEANHFWAAVLLMPYVAFAGLNGMWNIVAWFSLAQVLVNVYPILHLRHIRGRLDRTIGRISAVQAGRANATVPGA